MAQTVSDLEASKETLSKEVEELSAKNQSLEKKLTSSKSQVRKCLVNFSCDHHHNHHQLYSNMDKNIGPYINQTIVSKVTIYLLKS